MKVTEKSLRDSGWIGSFASDKQVVNAMRNANATEDLGYSHALYMYNGYNNELHSIKTRSTVFGWGKDSNGNVSASNGAVGYGFVNGQRMIFPVDSIPREATAEEESKISDSMPRPLMGEPSKSWQVDGVLSVHEIWPRITITDIDLQSMSFVKRTPTEADEELRKHLIAIHEIMTEQER